MTPTPRIRSVLLSLATLAVASPAFASFHLMQIEQVIGGVNGDTTRQAIQLRMRFPSQNLVSQGRIRAWDANGANPIVVVDMAKGVPNGGTGDRVLVASPNFMAVAPDFTMTSLIPPSYLAAGKLTWESDGGAEVWWGLAWGAYTGTNTGVTAGAGGNDADGNFNPPFPGALPSTNTQAVQFTGAASAQSTNNDADYELTAGASVFTNNAGRNGTVPLELTGFEVQ